ncbi:DUF4179 domain-containing protein [Sporosarcina sp. FSL K6-2383]|uniref:DUF4179 domain-containing protein n=1 Tax=Sporosarcina sp. FSL K6-2383 TaxID=2921556 RepID=UPI00315A85E5
MTNLNEQDWQKLTEELEAIEIPREALHQARVEAVYQHRLTKRRKRRLYSVASVAALVLLLFVTSIRVSPVFAQAVSKIPGFASIVDIIANDKGISDIVENNYYEELGISVTQGDYTLTLQGAIADHSGMMIFYKLESLFDLSKVDLVSIEVSQQGVPLSVATSYGSHPVDETTIHEAKVEIMSVDDLSYDNKTFEFNLHLSDGTNTKFTVPFTLTRPIEQPKVYDLNQSVIVDGQTIDIKQLKISPLRAEIKLAADEQNTMQLLQFTSVRLIDENGEDWGRPRGGGAGFGNLRDGEVAIFMESNYFRQPKKLTLVIDKIEALPKGSDYIEVDFEQQKVIYMPSELDVTVQVPSRNTLEVTYPKSNGQLFFGIVDQEGNEFSSNTISTRFSEEESNVTAIYTFDFDNAVNPIRLHINSYPLYLDGKMEIDIPLDE